MMKTIFDGERLPVSVRVEKDLTRCVYSVRDSYDSPISYQVFNEVGRLVANVTSPAAIDAVCRLLSESSDS